MRWQGRGVALLLWVLAAAYFALAAREGIEPVEEGHLVYFSWRVAEGALPYREFQHWYGPGVFLLNGLLLRAVGPELLAVRLLVIAFHALLAVAVFLLTRASAGVALAFVSYVVTLAIGGAPLWIFTAPYASSYQLPLVLAALTAFLLLPAGERTRLMVAGAGIGLAATFKPTGAAFPFIGLVFFLLARAAPGGTVDGADSGPWRGLAVAVAIALLLVLLALGTALGNAWTVAVLLLPLLALGLWSLRRVWQAPAASAARNLGAVTWLAVGCAIAPTAVLLFYAAQGEVGALAWSTLIGLPPLFALAVPYPLPDRAGMLMFAVATASLALAGVGAAPPRLQRARRPLAAAAAAAVVAVVLLPGPLLGDSGWLGLAIRAWFWVPPIAVWATTVALLAAHRQLDDRASVAVAFVSAALLPLMAPVADWAHLLQMLAVFLPLVASGLAGLWTSPTAPRRWPALLAAAWLVLLLGPFVTMLAAARLWPAPGVAGEERAAGIVDRRPAAAAARDVVRQLRAAPAGPVLVVPTEATLYFLSGRQSALDDAEFFFYAGVIGPQFAPADARRLFDQAAAIRRLGEERPPLVRVHNAAEPTFRAVYPELDAYLDRAYQRVATYGPYDVLEWRGAAKAVP